MGFGAIEFAYSEMARNCDIDMSECFLHREGGRAHFVTKRFDRTDTGRKIHMQSLGGLCHYDYNDPTAYSYEQAIHAMRSLRLSQSELEQFFRRAVFNVVARNQDDHVKNINFLMDKAGQWTLAPAFDVTYAWEANHIWLGQHQMSINGKRRNFELEDILALASVANVRASRARTILGDVIDSVKLWPDYAQRAGVDSRTIEKIQQTHRTDL